MAIDVERAKKVLNLIKSKPHKIGNAIGFSLLTDLHSEWTKTALDMRVLEYTLLAHRSSYKSSNLGGVIVPLLMILYPDKPIFLVRKTDDRTEATVRQIKASLKSPVMNEIAFSLWGVPLQIVKDNSKQIHTNICTAIEKGEYQFTAMSIGSDFTGSHSDILITDDIVTMEDRYSKAEREKTKRKYNELMNVLNRGGKLLNFSTPWHDEDCIHQLMGNIHRYDCYETGLMSEEQINKKKQQLTPALFSANYEMKIIASEDVIFKTNRPTFSDDSKLSNGVLHIDCAYGGEDSSAMTISRWNETDGILYVLGKVRKKHIDDCLDSFLNYGTQYDSQKAFLEDNADKGGTKKVIRAKGWRCTGYHESQNKNQKIRQYGYMHWERIHFHKDTDPEYIKEVMQYNDEAQHDDCPDTLACSCRHWDKQILRAVNKPTTTEAINPAFL